MKDIVYDVMQKWWVYTYPADKEFIKKDLLMLLRQTDVITLSELIDNAIENEDLDTMQTILDYPNDFRISEAQLNRLLGIVTALKLSK